MKIAVCAALVVLESQISVTPALAQKRDAGQGNGGNKPRCIDYVRKKGEANTNRRFVQQKMDDYARAGKCTF